MVAFKTLHILNKSPDHSRYRLCLSAIGSEDVLLLTENGVLGVTRESGIAIGQWFALAPDVEARGLSGYVSGNQAVSFDDMVELTASADKIISW